MSDKVDVRTNVLLNNRSSFTARQSIESLIAFARDQDEKIVARKKVYSSARYGIISLVFGIPISYMVYSMVFGYWRKIYPSSIFKTPFDGANERNRESLVPQMYLKEREIRKIELGMKDTEQLKAIYGKKQAI